MGAFEVCEVEVPATELEVVSLLYGGNFSLLFEDRMNRAEYEEFWSDPCWSE